MKIRFWLSLLFIALGCLPGVRAEEATTAPAADKPAVKAEKPETELEKTMTKMGKAWRQVRKAAREGQLTPATADFVATMRTNAEAAMKLTPALEAELPAADRAKFHADYKAQLKKLIATLSELENALKTYNVIAAPKLISEVGDLMKAGHKEFKKPEERKS